MGTHITTKRKKVDQIVNDKKHQREGANLEHARKIMSPVSNRSEVGAFVVTDIDRPMWEL